jgi:predicted DNA-binding transcriptional regulator AlpA
MRCEAEYEFLLVVDGITVDDEQSVAVIMDRFDGLMSWHRGVHRLAVSGRGVHAVDALVKLLARFDAEVPPLRVLRLDPELVGVPDIAERTGRSRQNVQQWVNGDRNAERPFPSPEGSSGRSPVWRWTEVSTWLEPLGLSDRATRPTREESAVIDVVLLQRAQAVVGGLPVGPLVATALAAVPVADELLHSHQPCSLPSSHAMTSKIRIAGTDEDAPASVLSRMSR